MVLAEWGEQAAEDQDEYVAESIFWGAAGGALVGASSASAPAHHRDGRGRRHGRHRARQPGAQRRAAQGLRPVPPWTRPAWGR